MVAGLPQAMSATSVAQVTIAVPSLQQGEFIDAALASIFSQGLAVDVRVLDAGSRDGTLEVLERWRSRLDRMRSHPDGGQAAAINEGLSDVRTEYVAWLNADDLYLPDGLAALVRALDARPDASFAFGRVLLVDDVGVPTGRYRVERWNRDRFARRCFVAQPGTLMRASAWQRVGGLDASLHMALDYDLWWKLAGQGGGPVYVDADVAATRVHELTKTMTRPRDHYREAMAVVRRHYGRVPLWWWMKMPFSIGSRAFFGRQLP